jgi:hypothetical protein
MLKLLGFCQLAIVSGIGANFLADVALANSLSGGNIDLTDALILSGGLGAGFGGRGINAALNTAVTANALGSLGDNNGLLGAAILANGLNGGFNGNGGFGFNNNFRPAFDLNGDFYYSSSYYVPPATTYWPTTYLPTTYLPTTYIPPATTYLPTTYLSTSLYPDYTTSYISSPYVGLGVGSYGCWVNGVWMASCFV